MDQDKTDIQEATAAKKDLVECPFCREPIKANAIKCKHCKTMLVPLEGATQRPQPKIYEPKPGGQPRYGHGFSILVLSFILFGAINSAIETDADGGVSAFIAALIFVGPWSAWVLCQSGANKALPILGLILVGLGGLMTISGG